MNAIENVPRSVRESNANKTFSDDSMQVDKINEDTDFIHLVITDRSASESDFLFESCMKQARGHLAKYAETDPELSASISSE